MFGLLRFGREAGGPAEQASSPLAPLPVDRALKGIPNAPPKSPPTALGPLREACATLDAVHDALLNLRAHIHSLSETAIAASTEDDEGLRALMAEDYEDHLVQVTTYAPHSNEAIYPLLGAKATGMRVPMGNGSRYAIAPYPITTLPHGLNLPSLEGGFALCREVAETLARLNSTVEGLDKAAMRYRRDRIFLSIRVKRLANL